MNTELFIEKYRLDVSADISTLLNFAIDDIKDFSSRSTTWSKTIVLPGTQNNNKLFGHIFQIGQANQFIEGMPNVGYNFNASKAADCVIFQDQMQTFKGVLRLMQINIIKGQIEYEVAVFGELVGLNVSLSGSLLEDLDFSAYDHIYNDSNVVASWVNTSGVNVYYPLVDYGTYSALKHNWDIRTFRPAMHVYEYIDKMMTAAGFRWSSSLFNTARFKTLIIPHNQKLLTRLASSLINASGTTNGTNFLYGQYVPEYEFQDYGFISFSSLSVASNFTNLGDSVFTYNQLGTITLRVRWRVLGTCMMNFGTTFEPGIFGIIKNAGSPSYTTSDFESYGVTQIPSATPTPFDLSGDFFITLNQNDDIQLAGLLQNSNGGSGGQAYNFTINEATLIVEAQGAIPVEVAIGDTVVINDTIPKNIKQIDFLMGIVKLFNLYVYEDRFDNRLIYFTPYVDFYSTDSTDSVDWTYKMNREKAIKVKPMSELTAKIYDFKFNPDSDYYNEQYRKRYSQGYGDYIFDSQFEFAEQRKALEILFSSTPLIGYVGEEKIYPTIFKQSNNNEEKIDSNIRIMQSKRITGVTSWDILDGVSVLASVSEYGYAGHFDDPDAPDNDLNFGALRELFFVLASGDLTKTQFNIYWSAYMAEITDKDSKLLSAYFYLTAKDILDLDFSKKVFVDGVLFRLNSIKDYNCSNPTDCEVELLKINFLIY